MKARKYFKLIGHPEKANLDVVFPTKDRHYRIIDALDNLSSCTEMRLRIIIVDSTKKTLDKETLDRFMTSHKTIVEIDYYNIDLNVSEARQYGIDRAETRFVGLIDDDMIIKHGSLDILYNIISNNKDIGIAYGIDSGLARFLYSDYKGENGKLKAFVDVRTAWELCITRNEMFKKKLVRYDKNFFSQEDFDMCLQTWVSGYRVIRALKATFRKVIERDTIGRAKRISGGAAESYVGNTLQFRNDLTNGMIAKKYSFAKLRKNGSLVIPLKLLHSISYQVRHEHAKPAPSPLSPSLPYREVPCPLP